jgi:hypothetical protein
VNDIGDGRRRINDGEVKTFIVKEVQMGGELLDIDGCELWR